MRVARVQVLTDNNLEKNLIKDKKPKQVENWCKILEKSFGNVTVSGAHIPSFDCNWNFASSILK